MSEFYVYELVDPSNGEVFYVGKGKGKRIHCHESEARRISARGNAEKVMRIRLIWAQGNQVVKRIVANCLTEAEAFAIERERIESLSNLTNIVGGTVPMAEQIKSKAMALLKAMRLIDEWKQIKQDTTFIEDNGGHVAFYENFKSSLMRLAGIEASHV